MSKTTESQTRPKATWLPWALMPFIAVAPLWSRPIASFGRSIGATFSGLALSAIALVLCAIGLALGIGFYLELRNRGREPFAFVVALAGIVFVTLGTGLLLQSIL